MAIAATDGVMPQTIEHLTILHALGISAGVVAITKCDAADEERRRRTAEEAAKLLPGCPLVEVSARTGSGIATLKDALASVADGIEVSPAREEGVSVMHVDRVFTVNGHGTVLTGTLWSGRIARGQRVLLLPSGREARVRAIESHGRATDLAIPRRRTALNLSGVAREEIARGDVVTVPDSTLKPTFRLDVQLGEGRVRQLKNGARIHADHGTRDAPARIAWLDDRGLIQLRLERQLIAAHGDRVVLRQIAPPDTLGGAVVVDPAPPRRGGAHPKVGDKERQEARAESADLGNGVTTTAAAAPEPRVELGTMATRILESLRLDGARPRPPRVLAEMLDTDQDVVEHAVHDLVAVGLLVRIKPDVFFPASSLNEIRSGVIELASAQGAVCVAELRDALRTSRKYAVALLEYFDAEKTLIRHGERHLLRRSEAGRIRAV